MDTRVKPEYDELGMNSGANENFPNDPQQIMMSLKGIEGSSTPG